MEGEDSQSVFSANGKTGLGLAHKETKGMCVFEILHVLGYVAVC